MDAVAEIVKSRILSIDLISILRTVLSKKRIDKKVPFTQIGCQRYSRSLTTQTSETAPWQSQKRYSIGSTFPSPKKKKVSHDPIPVAQKRNARQRLRLSLGRS